MQEILKPIIKEIVYPGSQSRHLKNSSFANIDWENLRAILYYHELIPFFYIILKSNPGLISSDILESFKNNYYLNLFKYLSLFQELQLIMKTAKQRNILLVPLKGFSFSESYYKRFGLRPVADIDLLIQKRHLRQGAGLLEDLGYKENLAGVKEDYWLNDYCHLIFIRNGKNVCSIVELHWSLDIDRYGYAVMSQLWSRLRTTEAEGEKTLLLSPEDTLFSLVFHQRRHGKILSLKYICDTGLILQHEKLDWGYIIRTAFKEKIRASLYFLLYQTQFILDIELNRELKALKLPLWQKYLIHKLIKKYIFNPPKNMNELKYAYVLSHLLFYDDLLYPLRYIINIPQEQFAKFYSLPFYSRKTNDLYRWRFLYIPYMSIRNLSCSLNKTAD